MEETENTTNENGESNNRWAWIVTGVVIVVVVAGFYMWPKENANVPEETPVVQQEEVDVATASLQQVSSSDEVSAIEQDLNNTDLSGLDKEIPDIETQVNP
jgi:hypothetical protein